MKKPTSASLVLITGASGGIGADLAVEYARRGHALILSARRVAELEQLAARLQRDHAVQVTVVPADLADPAGVDRLASTVEAMGQPLAALVNNAGYGLYGEFADTDLADTQRMMRLNMEAPVVLVHRLLPALRRARGHVLNVASTAAFQPGPYMAVYYATKSFLLSFSEALAEELHDSGVTVTALCPGPTASGFQDRAAMQDSALVKDKRLPSAAVVAAYGVTAAFRGQRVAVHGWQNWLLAQSVRFTPRRVVTRLVAHLSRRA
jgi:short-subunit dehydrogenase